MTTVSDPGSRTLRLEGFNAVVAGGSGNVGRYLVGALLDAGASVIVPSRSEDKLEEIKRVQGNAGNGRLFPLLGNIADESEGPRLVERIRKQVGPFHGAVASLGGFVSTPSVLGSSRAQLQTAVDGYLMAHFGVARALIPALEETRGSYTFINGPLAFDLWAPQSALVSIATAGQAMLARAVMKETASEESSNADPASAARVRVNELVIHTAVGWGEADKKSPVRPEDIGRYVSHLMSDAGSGVHGRTIHLKSPEQLREIGG